MCTASDGWEHSEELREVRSSGVGTLRRTYHIECWQVICMSMLVSMRDYRRVLERRLGDSGHVNLDRPSSPSLGSFIHIVSIPLFTCQSFSSNPSLHPLAMKPSWQYGRHFYSTRKHVHFQPRPCVKTLRPFLHGFCRRKL